MTGKMKAAVMTGIGKIEYELRDIPSPKKGEVLVKIMHCGVCGSDLHYYEHGRIGGFVVEKPIVLGHESAGVVVELGEGVEALRTGDRVTLEPGRTCGKCEFCKSGRYNLCPNVVFMATPPFDGAFMEYIAYPEDMCFKLPYTMDTMEGALVEPLAVGFHAAMQGGATVGQSAVILGAGCIGLMTLQALKARGVNEVYVVDMIDVRLKKALELGATGIFNAASENIVEKLLKYSPAGMDLVFETAGSKVASRQTPALVKRGGTIVLVGMTPDPEFPFELGTVLAKEATIKTVFRYRNLYKTCIDAISRVPLDVRGMVNKIFPFDEIPAAMDYNLSNKSDVIKVVIEY